MTFLITSVALDIAQVLGRFVFFCYFNSINPNGWMASPTTALVFFGGLNLRLISGNEGAVRLSFVFVFGGLVLRFPVGVFFVFFGRQAILFWAPGINISNVEKRLQVSLCFCITCFLYNFFSAI